MDDDYTTDKFYWTIAILVVVIILGLIVNWYKPVLKAELIKVIKENTFKLMNAQK